MKKSTFINLPSIQKIEVRKYLLFKNTWSYTVKNGLNLFVGANGVGKTTTANLIIYGLVGKTDNLTEEYFSGRKGGVTDESSIMLNFIINGKNYSIVRMIRGAVLSSFKINQKAISPDKYYQSILDDVGLNIIEDLTFLLEKFLIREEEGNYLLWNHNDQYKLLQLLINSKSFKQSYDKLSNDLKVNESKYKQLSEQSRKPTTVRLENLKKERLRELEKRKELKGLIPLKKDLEGKKNLLLEYNKNKEKFKEKLTYLTEIIAKSQSEVFESENTLEQLKFENSKMERKIYKHIYSDKKIQHSVHKLKYYDLCIYCNQKISSEKSNRIVQKIEVKCECPVCESHLKNDGTEEIDNSDSILKRLNSNTKESTALKKRISDLNKQIQENQANHDSTIQKFKEISKKISKTNIEVLDIKNDILFLSNSKGSSSKFDLLIDECEKDLERIKKKFKPLDKTIKTINKELKEKNETQAKLQDSILKSLNDIFLKYSSKYFFKDSSLVLNEKKGAQSKQNIKYFVPKFEGKERFLEKSCSTSERILLEYLFRVALIELYHQKSGHIPFMILETSEGAFDLTSTKHLALTINAFNSDKKINCIIIANFSKREYLLTLVEGIEKSKNRFNNFLEFSNLGEFQESDLKSYENIIDSFKLK